MQQYLHNMYEEPSFVNVDIPLSASEDELRRAKGYKKTGERNEKLAGHYSALKDSVDGVLGRVMDTITPVHTKYKAAAATVLKSRMNNIVVDTQSCGKLCMTKSRMRITLLPLETLRPRKVPEELVRFCHKSKGKYQLLRNVLRGSDSSSLRR